MVVCVLDHGKEGPSDPLHSVEAEAEESVTLRMGKTTKL
jgi:hypothetical protein